MEGHKQTETQTLIDGLALKWRSATRVLRFGVLAWFTRSAFPIRGISGVYGSVPRYCWAARVGRGDHQDTTS